MCILTIAVYLIGRFCKALQPIVVFAPMASVAVSPPIATIRSLLLVRCEPPNLVRSVVASRANGSQTCFISMSKIAEACVPIGRFAIYVFCVILAPFFGLILKLGIWLLNSKKIIICFYK